MNPAEFYDEIQERVVMGTEMDRLTERVERLEELVVTLIEGVRA